MDNIKNKFDNIGELRIWDGDNQSHIVHSSGCHLIDYYGVNIFNLTMC